MADSSVHHPLRIVAVWPGRMALPAWRVEDERGSCTFSLSERNNPNRVLAAYKGVLGPQDFPEIFEREAVGDWWRVRRQARLP